MRLFLVTVTIVFSAGRAGIADFRFFSVVADLQHYSENEKNPHGDDDDDEKLFHDVPFMSDLLMPNRYP